MALIGSALNEALSKLNLERLGSGELTALDYELEPRVPAVSAGSNRFSAISEIIAEPAFVGAQNRLDSASAGLLGESTQPRRAALGVKDEPLPAQPSDG